MKFKLTQDRNWVSAEEKEKLEKLGFKFEKETDPDYEFLGEWRFIDDDYSLEIIICE